MGRFVDRQRELQELDTLLEREGAKFVVVYGRRRVGKTTLLLHWVRETGLPYFYWVARREAADAQVDVVAINWREQAIMLGECKWGAKAIGRSVVHELVEKAPRVVPGDRWQVTYALFARAGFTDAARVEAQAVGALLVDVDRLDTDLRKALDEA